ncbi:MAG: bifunctional 2-C-methyl-D-erythritol 4-phosphate cytidylyltransferase/2-C-methyl-D-erythritol 2,4-cyclodiphosphate synthase [Alphaproteobacteria bacterium]|nr:bifunctional 2-C-methyl-D-erythritol 4-phosphate cytidylyltransferase/2-C-methyl-D-erythritol 2,4-cyclodiphosphate synthase [Alphaproteobacteria bacterium]QQS56337.1 MAG: bifunctional 2-C-methyl-D-erythritol 4-phosphate cytidylyltransferase/2-C-methyl-D-erythritol 2,4-cyclodiphosphate synthase [Alphaproteobacteria bacterium]
MQRFESFHVIVVAAGKGIRFGSALPKQYALLAGKPVLRHTLEVFLALPGLLSLTVVIDPDHQEYYEKTIEGLDLPPAVYGGADRKSSVYKGLLNLPDSSVDDLVLIHDAARPLVTADMVYALVQAMQGAEAATLALQVADTVLYSQGTADDPTCGTPANREHLWSLQTPQAFRIGVIKKAHERASPEVFATDDTALVSALGLPVKLVEGSRRNFKITTPDDLSMAQQILNTQEAAEVRTGFGYDVHRFADADVSPKSIRLCGVDIPFDRKLEGHSDADVGLHALTDALLGAIGEADIGTHFPPSDPKWKGADSAVFLEYAHRLLLEKGGHLLNADLTLICESPKIGPHRESIVARIADILGVLPSRINVKATTTEKLGFTGRKEGIAAQAVVSVSLPSPPHSSGRP